MGTQCYGSKQPESKETSTPSRQRTPIDLPQKLPNAALSTQHSPTNTNDNQPLPESKTSQISQCCGICKQPYGKIQRKPLSICQDKHTICSECKDMLMATKIARFKVCPFCKSLLFENGFTVNEEIFALII